MSDIDDLAARIDKLEMRVAYQDEVIDDLNKVVTDQWKKIDSLNRQLMQLLDRVQEVQDSVGTSNAPEPPPPHY